MPASPLAADDFAMPIEMVEVRAGRVLAVYRKPRRHAPLAVFIHGSCARMTQWRAQAEHLTATHGVLAFDLLGCGRSEKPRGWNCYSIDEHLADVLALVLKETDGQQLRHLLLLGHSAGATLALRCAAALEDEPNCHVQSIVLCGAAALPPLPSTALFRLPLCALELLKPLLDSGFEQLALHPATREANGELLAKARATNEANVMHMCRAYYRQLRLPTADELARAARGGRAVLLLHGEADGLVPPERSAALQAALGAAGARCERHVLPRASHQVMEEQPKDVNARIDAFLRMM